MTENSESDERPPAQEVVLDRESENRLISRIRQAVYGDASAPTSQSSQTPSELKLMIAPKPMNPENVLG